MDLRIYLLTLLSVVFIKGQPERTCNTYAASQLKCEELKPLGNGNICYKSETEVTNNGKVNFIRTATFYCNTDHHLNGPNVTECLQSFVHKGEEFINNWKLSPTEPPTCVSESRPCPMTSYITSTNKPKETTGMVAMFSASTPNAVRTEPLHETSVFSFNCPFFFQCFTLKIVGLFRDLQIKFAYGPISSV